jgi:hypothetical protein
LEKMESGILWFVQLFESWSVDDNAWGKSPCCAVRCAPNGYDADDADAGMLNRRTEARRN